MNVETVEVQVPFQTQLCLKWLLGLVLLQILQHGVFHTFPFRKIGGFRGCPIFLKYRNPPFFDSHHFSAPALQATVFRVRDDDARRKGAAPWRLGSGRDVPIEIPETSLTFAWFI